MKYSHWWHECAHLQEIAVNKALHIGGDTTVSSEYCQVITNHENTEHQTLADESCQLPSVVISFWFRRYNICDKNRKLLTLYGQYTPYSAKFQLLYGCKIWAHEAINVVEKMYLRLCKYILWVDMSTCQHGFRRVRRDSSAARRTV